MPITAPEDITGLRDWIRANDQSYGDGTPAFPIEQSSVLMAAVPWNTFSGTAAPILRTGGPGGRSYFSCIGVQNQSEIFNWEWSDGPDASRNFPSHRDTRLAWTEFLLFRVNDLLHGPDRDTGDIRAILHIFSGLFIHSPMIGVYWKDGSIPTVVVTNTPEFGDVLNPDRLEFAIDLGQWYFLAAGLDAATTLRARMASVSVCRQADTPSAESYTVPSYGPALGAVIAPWYPVSLTSAPGHHDDVDIAEFGTYGPWIGDNSVQDLFDYVQDYYGLLFAQCGTRRRMFGTVIG